MSSCAEPRPAARGVAHLAGQARVSIRSLLQGLVTALCLPAVFGLLLPLQARAQAEAGEVEASPYLQCLTPAPAQRVPPTYPEERFVRKEGARFEVELRFVDKRRGPQVRVLGDFTEPGVSEPAPEFIAAVEEYARQFRVPCLPDGNATVSLRQQFRFVPTDGRQVLTGRVADADQAQRRGLARCIRHLRDQRRPEYPASALASNLQGTVLARLTFTDAGSPPAVEILTEPSRGRFGVAVQRYAQGLRMPCHAGGPITVRDVFVFRIEDGRRVLLRDMDLRSFVGVLRSFPAPAAIDTNSMRCPFDLRLSYYAPFFSNVVGELGQSDPSRQPLIDWLEAVELDLPPDRANFVLGDTMTLKVPCVKLDIPGPPR